MPDNGDDGYLDAEGYLNYMECTEVDGYYLRPRCDGFDKTISMGLYYDPFCSQYAGSKVNIDNLGLGIQEDAFADFYGATECIDCSQNVSTRHDG